MSVLDYINRELNFLTILQDIYQDNEKPNFIQQNSILNDKVIMLAVTNKNIRTWGLNNIKFCGTDMQWQRTYDFVKEDLNPKKIKIETVKLGLMKELSLHKAKLFMQFLGPDKTIILDSMKSRDFVKALVLTNDKKCCVKLDGIE